MKELETIRDLFKPIQPTIKTGNKKIKYEEVRLSGQTSCFVYCFWQLKTLEKLEQPFVYRVVSDGCIDILFNHKQPAENFIIGFCRKYSEFQIGEDFDYIGIRFLPAAFPVLFGIDAKYLVEKTQELKNVLPDFSDWMITQLKPDVSFEKIRHLLNKKIEAIVENIHFEFDTRFFNSLILILKKNGYVDAEKYLNTGISPRQLRRLFNYYIGTSPKVFSNIVRFQYVLSATSAEKQLRTNKIYYDVGFYDQAHFIKTFKIFYGVTPSEAFR